MATKTKASKSKAAKGKTSKAATSKATRKATESKKAQDGPSKRELQKERDNELRERVVELRAADTSWGEISDELKITPGKAQFLFMEHCVAEGEVKRLPWKTEDQLVAQIRKAREAEDQYSSWGWIMARTGCSLGKVTSLAEEAGIPVRGSNVAVARAEKNGKGKKADTKTRTQEAVKGGKATTKKGKASAKATAARKRAAKKAGKTADPS